ncbi:MAG: hypothetical protein JSV78_04590 [Phycisphaerales bacterium]|nr:MAG: hypothetical protein JSV78_04590 [Phycisphaerales bacterium]
MRRAILALVLVVFPAAPFAKGEDTLSVEMKNDVLLRALVDELERNKGGLRLEDLEVPYFIEFGLSDTSSGTVSASLGAMTHRDDSRRRRLRTNVRVGSYELDNTNFRGGGGWYFGGGYGWYGGASVPIEDDYNAIRQAIWWAADRGYKNVVETFERKKAEMKNLVIEDKPDDFSREDPAVYFEQHIEPAVDLGGFERMAVNLSGIFREYPDIQNSSVTVTGQLGNRYLVNTEGTRIRTSYRYYCVSATATVQADDGMEFSDSVSIPARKFEALPPLEEASGRCREMIENLIAVKNAPRLDETYTGPVLFDAEPAATLFFNRFASQFAGGQRPVGSRTSATDFENKLGKRILPRFIDVLDDPAMTEINGKPVLGHYVLDDQGVKAGPVTLVEKGRLQAQVMSRNPSKHFSKSTGHGRPGATTSTLLVQVVNAANAAELKEQLLEICEDEDLEYGIRVASLGGMGGERYSRYSFSSYDFDFPGYGRGGSMPLRMYKLFPDGREELIRGAELAGIDMKAYKRMPAAGDEPYVYNTGSGAHGKTVVAPAMLFEELDLAKIDRDFGKPPVLPSPLARQERPAGE